MIKRWMVLLALRMAAILLVAFLLGIGLGHTVLFSGPVEDPLPVPGAPVFIL